MIELENIEIVGWEAAIRGMRNPMNSWDKSDTDLYVYSKGGVPYKIGPNDFDLMKRLAKAGTDHRKFMRMITVYLDITAPLYWWKEFDTYKVGTVANSCSTMHKIHAKIFGRDDFSFDHTFDGCAYEAITHTIRALNHYRDIYLNGNDKFEPKDKRVWWQMIQLLPSSYNQKRTVMLNYEVLANMYKSRKNHKLDEWRDFCKWIEELPYSELITGQSEEQ